MTRVERWRGGLLGSLLGFYVASLISDAYSTDLSMGIEQLVIDLLFLIPGMMLFFIWLGTTGVEWARSRFDSSKLLVHANAPSLQAPSLGMQPLLLLAACFFLGIAMLLIIGLRTSGEVERNVAGRIAWERSQRMPVGVLIDRVRDVERASSPEEVQRGRVLVACEFRRLVAEYGKTGEYHAENVLDSIMIEGRPIERPQGLEPYRPEKNRKPTAGSALISRMIADTQPRLECGR